ncbi:MAG: hypothetical protein QOF24_1376 [Verrucomicrobiota bacterium]|jgi:hypothetical protein
MHWHLIACLSALLLVGCRRPLDQQLVGEWLSGCSIDICIITALKPDHTFSQRFDQKDLAEPVLSGSWRIEGDQLVLRVTWEMQSKKISSVVGRDLRYAISHVQPDSLVATFLDAQEDSVHWKRRY